MSTWATSPGGDVWELYRNSIVRGMQAGSPPLLVVCPTLPEFAKPQRWEMPVVTLIKAIEDGDLETIRRWTSDE